MEKNSALGFLRRHKVLASFCLVLLFIISIVIIRAHLFLSNKCPGCGGFFLHFYTPSGYYDPLYKETLVFKKGEVSFSFPIDRYGSYLIGIRNANKNKESFHFSKDIGYKLFCESVISESGPKFGVPGDTSFGYKKIFFEESKLLRIDTRSDSEKEDYRRWFFTPHLILLGSLNAFDAGSWISGGLYDDIGRRYDCVLELHMDEADFFEGNLVVQRTSPH